MRAKPSFRDALKKEYAWTRGFASCPGAERMLADAFADNAEDPFTGCAAPTEFASDLR